MSPGARIKWLSPWERWANDGVRRRLGQYDGTTFEITVIFKFRGNWNASIRECLSDDTRTRVHRGFSMATPGWGRGSWRETAADLIESFKYRRGWDP